MWVNKLASHQCGVVPIVDHEVGIEKQFFAVNADMVALSKIDIRKLLAVSVTHDEAVGRDFGSPGRREAARCHSGN
jgi:hypothetical protein